MLLLPIKSSGMLGFGSLIIINLLRYLSSFSFHKYLFGVSVTSVSNSKKSLTYAQSAIICTSAQLYNIVEISGILSTIIFD